MSEELSAAKAGLRVAIVSVVIAILACYLTLASDNKWWPFGVSVWIPATVSAFLVLVTLVVTFRLLRSGGFTSQALVLTLAPALATGLLVPVWADVPEQEKPAAPPKVTIGSPVNGTVQGNKMEVSGTIDAPLGSGQVIFVVVQENPEAGLGQADRYVLQPGPCEVYDGGRAWRCRNVETDADSNSQKQIVALGAEGGVPADFGVRSRARLKLKETREKDPSAEDPTILHGFPGGVMEFSRVTVKIR